ncbi:MAG: extracellular solute-binding protein [Burkholderiales bacterium]|nr:extracellular solute-binding protein [Anaerolineae bacterium]
MKLQAVGRLLFLGLVVVLLTTSITAAQDVIELTATAVGVGTTATALQAVADQWNADHPEIQVRVEARPDDVTWQAAAPSTEFAASDGPDLSWWWCTRAQSWRDMSATGMLAPLDDLYESEGWVDAFPSGTLDYFRDPEDGHYYGVQIDTVWTPIIYYNADVFEELGLSEPTTWEEFFAVSDALTEAGYIPMSAVYDMQLQNHLPQALMLRSWTLDEYNAFAQNWSGGADPATFDFHWTDPNSVRIFQTIKDMADHNVWGEGFQALTDYNQAISLFTSEAAAMYVMGIWEAGASVASAEFNVDWFYYPSIEGQEPLGVVGSWPANCFIVFEDRPHVEESKQFLAYLISPEGMQVYMEAGGLPPGRADLSADMLGTVLHENTTAIAGEVAELGSVPLWEAYVTPELFQGIREQIDLMLSGVVTPEEAAAAIEELNIESRENN